jgi:ACT domain-containing protein
MDELERLTRVVVRAVGERLGSQNPDVVELVVREVVGAMSGASGVPAASTPSPPEGDTVTTGLGAVLPRPANHEQPSLELCASCLELHRRQHQNRAVVTTTGRNARGVVATMARQVAEAGGDIQDISQTIISEYFTMIMVVDIEQLTVPFIEFKERVVSAASDLGIHAVVMHEDVMRSLQRV